MNKFGIGGGEGFLRALFDAAFRGGFKVAAPNERGGKHNAHGKNQPAGSKLSRHCARRHLHSHMWG